MRFKALDGWRGIAALLVALYHLQFYNHLQELPFIRNSYLFVDFFFVLSGFVMGHAYSNRLTTRSDYSLFIIKRIGRLWPLHVFVLILFILLELLKMYFISSSVDINTTISTPFSNDYSVQTILPNLFLIHSLGIYDSLTWNNPSWSISVEMYTYLIFLVVIILFKSNLFIKILLITFSLSILYLFPKDLGLATFDYGIFRCVLGFFLGLLTYQFHNKYPAIKIRYATFIEILLILSISLFVSYIGHGQVTLIAPFLFVIMVYVFSLEQGAVSLFLKANPIQKLGEWSYSIYMMHAFIIVVIGRIIMVLQNKYDLTLFYSKDNPINSLGVDTFYYNSLYFMDFITLLYLIIVIFISSISYKLIEKKGVIFFKRFEKKQTKYNKHINQNNPHFSQ